MKIKTFMISVAVLAAGVFFTGCEGKEGPIGPVGTKGDQGVAGPQGPAGTKGDPGATGTANVIYSDWLNLPAFTENGVVSKSLKLSAKSMSRDIIEKGLLIVYVRQTGTTPVILPHLSVITSNAQTVEGTYRCSIIADAGTISYFETWISNGVVPLNWQARKNPIFQQLRYILIPGGNQARVAGLDYSNYEAVKAHYGLTD